MAKRVVYEIEIITADLERSDRSIEKFIQRNKELKSALQSVPEQGTAAFKELDARIKAASGGTETLTDRVSKLRKEYADNRNAIRDFNKELRDGQNAANTINGLRQEVIKLNRELDNTEIGSKRFKELTTQSAVATKNLKDLEQQTLRFQRNVGNYQSIGQGIINTFNQVGKAIFAAFSIQGIINLTQRAVGDLVQTARDYSQAIATVGAISGATEEQMVTLNAEARRLGESTAFSATSAAEGMIELSKAGFTVEEQLESTEPVLNLAIAANAELGRTSEVAATAIRTYGFEASEAGRVTDVIAATFTSSQTTLESFAESFKQLGPSARSLKVPFEESAAVIGLLGDQGLRGTDATTALKTAFARLAASPPAVRKEMERLNVTAFDQQGQFIGIANLIEKLQVAYADYSDEQKQASISQIFGNRAISQANILLNSQREVVTEAGKEMLTGADAIRAYTEQLEEAGAQAGEFTKNIADQQLDSFEGDITLLQSATEGLQLALFDLVEDNLRGFVQGVRTVVTEITALTKGQGELAEFLERNSTIIRVIATVFGAYTAAVIANTIATTINTIAQKANSAELTKGSAISKAAAVAKVAYTAALQVATGQISILTGAIKVWRAAQLAINAALTANPIGIIVVAIGVLVAGIIALYNESQQVRAAVAGIGEAFSAIWARIQPVLSALGKLLSAVFQVGFQIAKRYFEFVVSIWVSIFNAVRSFVTGAVKILQNVASFITGVFRDIYDGAIEFLSPILSIFDPFIQRVKDIFGQVYDSVVGIFEDIKNAVVDAVGSIFEFFGIDLGGVTDAFNDVVDAVGDAADGAGQDVADAFQKGFNDRIREEFAEELKETLENEINNTDGYTFDQAKARISEELAKGTINQEDADRILEDLQEAVNSSDRQVNTNVGVNPLADTGGDAGGFGGPSNAERDAFNDRLESYQEQAAELERIQLRLSERGLEILRQQRLKELSEDSAFQALRAEEQIRILQDIENEYTEARLKLAQGRQKELAEEQAREIELIQERAVLLRQITTDLGVEEVEEIRTASQARIEATTQRYEAETNLIVQQTERRQEQLRVQLDQNVITEEEYNEQLLALNESSAARLKDATRRRDAAIIATTEEANERLIELAEQRQEALNEVRLGAVTDITQNFVDQLNELDELRAQDLINAQEYVQRREEIEQQLNRVLILATDQTAEAITGALAGAYDAQVQEAINFRTDRLEALREAYSADAGLASAAFEEQRQLLEQRRADGIIDEDTYRAELETIQNTYYGRIASAQQTYQAGAVQAQQEFDNTLQELTRARVQEVEAIEDERTADLTSQYEEQVAELENLRDQGLINAEEFNQRSVDLETQYQNDVAEIQRQAQAGQVAIDQEAFDARTRAAQDFRDQNVGTFDAVYQSQVEAISEAANAQQGILESTNATLLQLGESYNQQSIAENQRYTAEYTALIQDRSTQITSILDGTIVNLSGKFEEDLARLQALREADAISAEEYANRVATLQENFENELATIQEQSQANTSEFLQLSFEERIQAADSYHQRRIAQIEQQRQEELQAAQQSADEQLNQARTALEANQITEEEFTQLSEQITQNHTDRVAEIEDAYRTNTLAEEKRFADERKQTIDDFLAEVELAYQQEQVDLTSRFNEQLAELTRLRNSDLIDAEEYADRRADIEEQLEDALLQNQLRTVRARLSAAEEGSKEYLRLKAQELALTKSLLDNEVQATEKAEQQKQQAIEETRQAQKEALQQLQSALSSITSIIQQNADNRIAVLERERDEINSGIEARREDIELQFEATQRSLENANLSEEEKERRLEAAEQRKDQALAQLEEEQEAEQAKIEEEIAAEELKVARIQDIEARLQAFRDLMTSLQLANDSLRALSAVSTAATEISAATAVAGAEGAKAVAKTAGSVPFPANLLAIAGLIAAVAGAVASIKRLFGKNEQIAKAEEGGLIEIYSDDIQYMKAGGESGLRKTARTIRTTERKRRKKKAVTKVPRGRRIALGKPHNVDGSLGGGLLTELERGEWVVPVAGVNMFKPQLAWMTQQANAKRNGQPFSEMFPEELFPTQPGKEIRRRVPSASRPPVINQPTRYSMGFAQDGGEVLAGLSGAISATDLDETNTLLREVIFNLGIVASAAREGGDVNLSLLELNEKQAILDASENRSKQ